MKKMILVSLITVLFTAACSNSGSSSKKGNEPAKPVAPDEPVTGVTKTDWSQYLYQVVGKCENGKGGRLFRYLSSDPIPEETNAPDKEFVTVAQIFLDKNQTYKLVLESQEIVSRQSNGDYAYEVVGSTEHEGTWEVVDNAILLYNKEGQQLATGRQGQFGQQNSFNFRFKNEQGSSLPNIRFGYIESNVGYNEICQ